MIVKKLHAEWAAKIMPKGASDVQKQEMERAFYAGFFSALAWQLQTIALMKDEIGVEELDKALKECETYFRTLSKAPHDISRS